MLGLLALLLFADSAPALTLTQFEALPPADAAARALEGREHRQIAKVEPIPGHGAPPGIYEYRIVEQPFAVSGGCRRQVWRAKFSSGRNPREQAVLSELYAGTEVALSESASCDLATFAYLNPGTDPDRALLILRRLREIADGQLPAEFTCRSEIGPDICASPASIRQALMADAYLMSAPIGRRAEITLGSPNTPITQVSFDPLDPRTVQVVRTIPAPF